MISQYNGASSGGMAFDPNSRVLLIYPRGNLSALLFAVIIPMLSKLLQHQSGFLRSSLP